MTKNVIERGAGIAEAINFTGEGATSATDPFTVTGNGGPAGKYRIKATAANWNGGASSFQTASGTVIASFGGDGRAGHVDTTLSAGGYRWSHTGSPQGLQLAVQAI